MLESILNREVLSAAAIYCFGSQKSELIINFIDRTFINISQLSRARFSLVSCTCPCHNKSQYFYAMRTAYTLARWLHFNIISIQFLGCPTQPKCH